MGLTASARIEAMQAGTAVTSHSNDVLNRLTKVVYSKTGATSRTITYTYDQTGTGYANGVGRLTSTATPEGSGRYTYDSEGRLASARQVVNLATGANAAAVTRTVGYEYDTAGRLSSLTYPSGRVVTMTYTDGQVSGIALKANATAAAVPIISGVQWEPFGGVKGWQWNLLNGTTASLQAHERVRDTYGRLVRYRLGATIRDITYDEAGRITKYTHHDATTAAAVPGQDQTFSYDELDRLVSVSAGGSSWALAYDANGNRTSVVLNGTSSSYTTAASSNQLTATTNPTRGFTLDAAGNTLARSTTNPYTAAYSLENRLETMTVGTAITSYSYDALGQRTRKHTGTAASTTIFAYDQEGQLLGEYSATGAAVSEYVWFNNEPIAVFTPNGTSAPNVFNIHSDHLGTPRVILNKANQSRWSWMAEPFGTTAANTNPQGLGNFTFNLRMPGQYADSETGLFYNYFRDYDAGTGRYTQSDPIGRNGGVNTYGYVGANPASWIDPRGLDYVPRGTGGGGHGSLVVPSGLREGLHKSPS
jgi:RHS repeat-associated protein